MRILKALGSVLAGLFLMILVVLLAMTQSPVATPTANYLLAKFSGDGSSVASASLGFPRLNRVHTRDLNIPDRLEISTSAADINPLGFLPGLVWVSRLAAADGGITFSSSDNEEASSGDELFPIAAWLDELDIRDLTLRRSAGDIKITRAVGSLRSGMFSVEADSEAARLMFKGQGDTVSVGAVTGQLEMSGENLADLGALAGIAAPDTPPYSLKLDLDYADRKLDFDILPSVLGDSDIIGTVSIDFGQEIPLINARLDFTTLDFDDLGIVFGIPVGIGEDETVSDVQQTARDTFEASERLIPNAVIDFTRLDAVDGEITVTAEQVVDSRFDLTSLDFVVNIDGRVVRVTDARLAFSKGELAAFLTLDGSRDPAVTTAEGTASGISAESLGVSRFARGSLDGEFEITTVGSGFREAAATLTGNISFWSNDLSVAALPVEAAGLDLVESLVLIGEGDLSKDDPVLTEARCAVARMSFKNGQGKFSPAVFDTNDSLVILAGGLDLADESLDFEVRSDAKDASWGALVGNVTVGGTLQRSRSLNVFKPEQVLQVGLAALLSSVAGPLGALAFIEPGSAEDSSCKALIERANVKSAGAAAD